MIRGGGKRLKCQESLLLPPQSAQQRGRKTGIAGRENRLQNSRTSDWRGEENKRALLNNSDEIEWGAGTEPRWQGQMRSQKTPSFQLEGRTLGFDLREGPDRRSEHAE